MDSRTWSDTCNGLDLGSEDIQMLNYKRKNMIIVVIRNEDFANTLTSTLTSSVYIYVC